jgi:trehalose 2-sulfotransferase
MRHNIQLIYIIATTPRTGGHYLCDLLGSTGICGHPSEYLLIETDAKWRKRCRCQTRLEYLDFYLNAGLSANGVLGAKLTWRQYCEFRAELGGSESLNSRQVGLPLERIFSRSRYILLRRRDRLRQAISYSRALQTGRWSSKTVPASSAGATEVFDTDAIAELVGEISACESLWLAHLDEFAINYLELYYEDLIGQPRKWIAEILRFLEIDEHWNGMCRSDLQRQSDQLTEEWVRRYGLNRGTESGCERIQLSPSSPSPPFVNKRNGQ